MINIILTGLNGYGGNFISELLNPNNGSHQLIAVVSRNPQKSEHYDMLVNRNINFYEDIESCLSSEKVDLAIITTPMHVHYTEVMSALHRHVSVYCEKPLAPTYEECMEIKDLAKRKNCIVAVGFQWSFSESIHKLKNDIMSNRFGKILQMKTIVNWNRPKHYYSDSAWKGKQYDYTGKAIYENLLSNATSHYLHNLLFLSGKQMDTSSYPKIIEGECYRGHSIETFDTACIRIKTDSNVSILYLATFLSYENEMPRFEITFENGTVYFPDGEENNIVACLNNGERIQYGSPEDNRFTHYKQVVDHILYSKHVSCHVETILPITIVGNAVSNNIKVIDIPKQILVNTKERVYIENIPQLLNTCYEQNKLFYEAEIPWAKEPTIIHLK